MLVGLAKISRSAQAEAAARRDVKLVAGALVG
jgi:hypothetical protein